MKYTYSCLVVLFSCLFLQNALAQADDFEDDDTANEAGLVIVRNETQLARNFHDEGDQDWIRLAVRKGAFYEVTIKQVGSNADPVLAIYGFDSDTVEFVIDDGLVGDDEIFSFEAEQTGIYYVSVSNFDQGVFGDDTEYTLAVFEPVGDFAGPDLEVSQSTTYLKINQGSLIDFAVTVANLGGQREDNTANNVVAWIFLANGMTRQGDLPSICVEENAVITCDIGELPEQGQVELDLGVIADNLGRRNIVSKVAAFEDSLATIMLPDDRFSNNEAEIRFTVVERPNFGVNVRAEKQQYAYNETLRFYAKLDTNAADLAFGGIDLYLAVQAGAGPPVYIADLTPTLSGAPVALLSDWTPVSVPDTEVLSVVIPPGVAPGEYTWSLIFARTGSDVTQEENQLSRAEFPHSIVSD